MVYFPTRLFRHFQLQIQIRMGRIGESLEGLVAFLLWAPRLFRGLIGNQNLKAPTLIPIDENLPPAGSSLFPVSFINLSDRKDRLKLVTHEFARVEISKAKRIPAIKDQNGALGCAKSHVKALDALSQANFQLAMVCEDDVEFLTDRQVLNELISEFQRIPGLGVLCLANRVRGPRLPISKMLSVSNNIQMAACYVIKPFALKPLRQSFSNSVLALGEGADLAEASIDQLWKKVQTNEVFFSVPRAKVARQRKSYSDIAGRIKQYH